MLADSPDEYLAVATTRPETILGDTAVAVHPDDDRYKKYVGKMVLVPILNREVPVIADDYVDIEFGTGALKITPGHDPHDYEIGQHHNLDLISILDKDARINENGGPYAGQDRFECRKNLWADMAVAGLVIKEEDYVLNVPRSQRGGEIIEPMISTQWFVTIKPLADAALEAVKDGRITIVPERFSKVYYNWMENIQDWCISRQLWWGHRIPVWYCQDCKEMIVSRDNLSECPKCGSKALEQDPDVLDTWFSSGLWPFSTLGWPEETPDLKYFYPTTMMETGYDILFFWVARMIMFGIEFGGDIPFSTVYLHGLIRDENGQKMSKTKGNVIDPLIVMDEMGTDALRFTLLVGSTPGNDMNLSVKKVEANRNFANKIWNAGRFVTGAISQAPKEAKAEPQWTLADSWVWAKLQALVRDVERLFSGHQYGEAGRLIYDFFWADFADWYVEIAKLQLRQGGDLAFYTAQTLVRVLDTCLRLLHPFTPFVTEELWGHLKQAAQGHSDGFSPKGGWEDALIVARWPEARAQETWETTKTPEFEITQDIVRAVRNLRAEKKIPHGVKIPATMVGGKVTTLIKSQMNSIGSLASIDQERFLIFESLDKKPQGQVSQVVSGSGVEIYLPLADMVDTDAEIARLEKELAEVNSQIERLDKLLTSPFAQKAPAQVVDKEREKLKVFKDSSQKLTEQLENLK